MRLDIAWLAGKLGATVRFGEIVDGPVLAREATDALDPDSTSRIK
jgi:hypothetical protein